MTYEHETTNRKEGRKEGREGGGKFYSPASIDLIVLYSKSMSVFSPAYSYYLNLGS